MVTRSQLDALQTTPPSILQAYDADTLFSEALEYVRQEIPEWDGDEDSILYKAIRRLTFRHYLVLERVNNSIRRSFLYYATGSDLDAVVRARGLTRQAEETDAQLKERALRATQISAVGTLKGMESLVYNWPGETNQPTLNIQDVQVKIRSDNKTIDVWPAVRGTNAPIRLAADAQTALQAYLNDTSRKYIGTEVLVQALGVFEATITADVTYDPEYDLTTLQSFVNDKWQAECQYGLGRVGGKIAQSRVIACLFIEGIREITLTRMTMPGTSSGIADLPAMDGRLYVSDLPTLNWTKGT